MDRQVITVDIAPGSNAQQRLLVAQGDIGRPLGVRIIQNGLPLNCTGYTAHLYVLKPDHNYYECTCTISNNNLISWDTAEQETPVAGECLAEIRITSGTNDIGTACFVEYVEASPADLGYASESFISSMTEYVDAAQQAAEEATQAVADVDNVNDVAVDASGHIVLSKVLGSTVTSDETVLQPADIENDLLATTAGKVLDARQGKALKDLVDGLDEDVSELGDTVDEISSQISIVAITNEYSTVLEAINAYRSTKKLPFCINKTGSSAITDLPSDVTNTCEWNVICSGSSQRLTAKLTIFSGGGERNGRTYTANIFTGSYYYNWEAINGTKVDYLTLINTQSLTSTYVTSNTYSGRSFASGVWLVFNAVHKGWVLESQMVPYASFNQATGIELRCMVSSTPIEVDVKYVSDTSFQAKYIGTMPDSDLIYVSCWAIVLS